MDLALPIASDRAPSDLSKLRINLTYLWRHGRLPDLKRPATFTELVQNRKLHERDARYPLFADKVAAKKLVAESIGEEWIIPTLWHGAALPPAPYWDTPYVVKARHGCNQSAFVHSGDIDWAALQRRAARWVTKSYGFWLDEWLYAHIPKGLLVEPFIGSGQSLPIDYKFYVFAGRVEYVQVHLDRAGRHRWMLFDRGWQPVSSQSAASGLLPPPNLHRMIEAAEELGRSFDFVRVDLYDVDDRPWFGEMTFYPGSGLDRFDPVSLDITIGAQWQRAREAA